MTQPVLELQGLSKSFAATQALKDIMAEVELGFDPQLAFKEAQRCLNCDVQTVFTGTLCIECDACVDICPMDCITFTPDGEEADVRQRLEQRYQAGQIRHSGYIHWHSILDCVDDPALFRRELLDSGERMTKLRRRTVLVGILTEAERSAALQAVTAG